MAVLLPEPNKLCFLVWQTRVKNTIMCAFQNPTDPEDTSLFVKEDIGLQRHHYLSPPDSPFFTPADLLLLSRNPYLSGYFV